MNKLMLIISALCVLNACVNYAERDPDTLPGGIMLPVEGTGAIAGGSFMPEIEPQSMPNRMT